MISIFTIPKPFQGHIAVIQRNAIKSWLLLRPQCEVILFGVDEGTAEVAKELGVRNVPEVALNEYGTPLLNNMFEKAQSLAKYNLLCYVNADIILMNDFMKASQQVAHWGRLFLMVGQRWDVDISKIWDFSQYDWEAQLRIYSKENGKLHPATGIDYFVFTKGLYGNIPPFAIGRTVWDNWLIYEARHRGIAVIDATQEVMAIHQNHDWSHVPGGEKWAWEGPEAKRNLELAGGWEYVFTLQDTTHKLALKGPKLLLNRRHLQRRIETLPTLYPYLMPFLILVKVFMRGFRMVYGLASGRNYNSKEDHK